MKLVFACLAAVVLGVSLAACGSSSPSGMAPTANPSPGLTPLIAGGNPPYVRVATHDGKKILTDSNGMTLYVIKGDKAAFTGGACVDECLATWPPLVIPMAAYQTPTLGLDGPVGTFRKDGIPDEVRQVIYKDTPLYRYSGDHAPGDTNGAGQASGAWSVAVP